MSKTEISWTQHTWGPVRGCRRVSPGCGAGAVKGPNGERGGCYAETMAARLVRMGGYEWDAMTGRWVVDPEKKQNATARRSADRYRDLVRIGKDGTARWTGKFAFDADKLAEPLRRKAPTMYFVNSMSDLFGEGLTNEQIAAVFGVMLLCGEHTFQVLTKRAKRLPEWFEWVDSVCERDDVEPIDVVLGNAAEHFDTDEWDAILQSRGLDSEAPECEPEWPLPNVWLGVSCERQEEAEKRIPLLLQCPAAVRWVSAEPLLGPIDFDRGRCDTHGRAYAQRDVETNEEICAECAASDYSGELSFGHWLDACAVENGTGISWVVFGGESGHGARPCDIEWIRSGVEQCREAGVPAYVKQLGAYPVDFSLKGDEWSVLAEAIRTIGRRVKVDDKKGADMAEWPEDLLVRQWPEGFVPPKTKKLPVVSP